jgi:DNA repair protein RadD
VQLRPYQLEAVAAAQSALAAGAHPALALATGTGKSLVIAALAQAHHQAGGEVWALTHVQQLVAQNAAAYQRFSGCEPAVVCAGLGRRQLRGGVTFASVQSLMGALLELRPPTLIIIDEAHRVPHDHGQPALYASVLRRYPAAQRVAMTATPWRSDNGRIYGSGDSFWFDVLAFEYSVTRAVCEGYLSPLVGVQAEVQLDCSDLPIDGDFNQTAAGDLETREWLTAVAESVGRLAAERRHVAVYCPTVAAALRTAVALKAVNGWGAELLHGGMDQPAREKIFARFASGESRAICSVDTITTGFDFPALDCIVSLRPTLSSSLWVQIQGRGTRLAPAKKNCVVLDYAGNLLRLGGVGMYETFYREKNLEVVAADEPAAPHVRRERRALPGVRGLPPLDPMTGREATEGTQLTVNVHSMSAVALPTRRNPTLPVVLVQYACTTAEGIRIDAAAFLNTENPDSGTLEFFSRRRLAIKLPTPARSAVWSVRHSPAPARLTVQRSGRYWNVVREHFEDPAS